MWATVAVGGILAGFVGHRIREKYLLKRKKDEEDAEYAEDLRKQQSNKFAFEVKTTKRRKTREL